MNYLFQNIFRIKQLVFPGVYAISGYLSNHQKIINNCRAWFLEDFLFDFVEQLFLLKAIKNEKTPYFVLV